MRDFENLSKKEKQKILCLTQIGSKIEIIDSKNKNLIGKKGILIYESANLFYMKEENNKIKKILKNSVTIKLEKNGKALKIDGTSLLYTLKGRIKKIR